MSFLVKVLPFSSPTHTLYSPSSLPSPQLRCPHHGPPSVQVTCPTHTHTLFAPAVPQRLFSHHVRTIFLPILRRTAQGEGEGGRRAGGREESPPPPPLLPLLLPSFSTVGVEGGYFLLRRRRRGGRKKLKVWIFIFLLLSPFLWFSLRFSPAMCPEPQVPATRCPLEGAMSPYHRGCVRLARGAGRGRWCTGRGCVA